MIDAGKLRHRVEIQSPTRTRDEIGGVVIAWGTEATRSALVEALAGEESYQSSTVRAGRTVQVTIRYYAGLETSWRFLYGERALNIEAIVFDPDKVGMVCRCREEV